MSDQDTIAIVRAYDEALETMDHAAAIKQCFAEDAFYYFPGNSKVAGTWRGHDGILDFYDAMFSVVQEGFIVESKTMTAADGYTFEIRRTAGRNAQGDELDTEVIAVNKVENGLIVGQWFAPLDPPTIEAFYA